MKTKRIRELAEQSKLIKRDSKGNLNVWSCYDPDLEKFAELIIQECANQLDANRVAVYDANKHHEYWNCGVKWAVAKIRDHVSQKLKYIDCNKV